LNVAILAPRSFAPGRHLPQFLFIPVSKHDFGALGGKTRTVASPIPEAAPVTITTLLSKRFMG
jgi:hypothetical protein